MRPSASGNPCEPLAAGLGSGCGGWTARRWAPVLDSFHILARGDTLDALPSVPVEKITFVQLADAPYMKMDLLEWSRHFRCFPGQGSCRWRRLPSRSPAVATAAPRSLEIFNDGFRASPNGATAKDGYRSLLWLEEQTRRRLPTCDADLFSPPPLPVYHGLEFIEFAASAAEAQRLGQHLQALGFQHEGSHRSRQVTLWRNGGARIVINHQPHSWADHFINATGYRSARWRCGSSRARRLSPAPARWGMPLAGRRRAERNADPGDLRPDGSLIYLIDAGEAIYERDFHLRDGVTVREDYLGIDHLALGMEADSRDNWVMFFRTVFGFSLEHEQTLPDPYGLVRSPGGAQPAGRYPSGAEYFAEPGDADRPFRCLLPGGGAAACRLCLPRSAGRLRPACRGCPPYAADPGQLL